MSPIRRFLMILALTAMWSPSFLFIKLAVQELPPLTIVTLRVSMGAAIVYAILRWRGGSLPKTAKFWAHSTVMALFASALPFTLFCFAEQTIDSALAAILNGASPMFTALLAHAFIPNDRLHVQKVIGILLSGTGVLLLFSPDIRNGLVGTPEGMVAAASAALSYAVSHVYAKRYIVGQPAFVAPTAQLAMSAVLLAPLALMIDAPFSLDMPSSSAIGAICGLTLLGTVCAFIIYYKLLEHCGPTAVSMTACFFPVLGMLLGFIFLQETLTLLSLAAASLIFVGVAIVNETILIPGLRGRKQEAVR